MKNRTETEWEMAQPAILQTKATTDAYNTNLYWGKVLLYSFFNSVSTMNY